MRNVSTCMDIFSVLYFFMRKIIYIITTFLIGVPTLASPFNKETCSLGWEHVHHDHNEEAYQYAWCSKHNGIIEFENKDYTRIDCLTDTHAVEFDFANKWHESIGQALHYSIMSGKRAKVVLILDNPKKQKVYYYRIKKISKYYNFDTEYVTNDILNINNKGRCFYNNCKCNK